MMRNLLLCFLALISFSACAKGGVKEMMEAYLWQKRVLVIFSPSVENPDFQQQNEMLSTVQAGLNERDMVIWRIVADHSVSIDGARKAQLGTPRFYRYFKTDENAYTVILLGKDGEEKLRQYETVSEASLFSLIDAMPMRQREM